MGRRSHFFLNANRYYLWLASFNPTFLLEMIINSQFATENLEWHQSSFPEFSLDANRYDMRPVLARRPRSACHEDLPHQSASDGEAGPTFYFGVIVLPGACASMPQVPGRRPRAQRRPVLALRACRLRRSLPSMPEASTHIACPPSCEHSHEAKLMPYPLSATDRHSICHLTAARD